MGILVKGPESGGGEGHFSGWVKSCIIKANRRGTPGGAGLGVEFPAKRSAAFFTPVETGTCGPGFEREDRPPEDFAPPPV